MKKHQNIYQRKEPVQERSKLMVEDIIEAANIVLLDEGLDNFNTNRVAEVAGVSIGSLYQYFPSKESLLFQLQRKEIATTWKQINDLLENKDVAPQQRLESAIYLFFKSESQEFALRNGLECADVYFDKMQEYQELEDRVIQKLSNFLSQVSSNKSVDIKSQAELIFIVTTALANRVTQQKITLDDLQKWSKICSDLLCGYLNL